MVKVTKLQKKPRKDMLNESNIKCGSLNENPY